MWMMGGQPNMGPGAMHVEVAAAGYFFPIFRVLHYLGS